MAELTDADRAAIHDLYGHYAVSMDGGDAEAWADCFAADGRFAAGELVDARGREQLAEFARANHAANGAMRHHITTIALEPADGGATARSYALLAQDGQVVATAYYDDELVRDADGWRFASRVVLM